ncbi:anthranilate synthase family protein [Streptomyces sp. H34-S4]|uniref:anthranilate synthase family protein n=1 Tax=Streptomyces sp. H34-S4 TaxID=2996463 RepID=UPI00226F1148|nr:anthranilate synthase family protein [Streptomyces sp. H34-S4]MCY0938205.1 anthranilate synthase family protein [Streptomyces sp. H34-S4]
MTSDLLEHVLQGRRQAYALLHRPDWSGERLEVLAGPLAHVGALADLPLPPSGAAGGTARHDVLALVPYRQITERGYACTDDGEPLIALSVTEQEALPLHEALRRLPDEPVALTGDGFDVPDEEYAELVRRVVADEIGRGEGANFVIQRSFTADVTDYNFRSALSFFRRLLQRESGAYWTYLVRAGERTFVGASPERHISVADGNAVMNPISGTYRYPASGPTLSGVLDFLADRKETDELCMVVDEELKMMARICPAGGRVTGPHLREMARLAHTEYYIEGRTDRDPREILRETMFAPTVTGSPLESAAKVLQRYERTGRGYYSGVVALIGRDGAGRSSLDSAIMIRTADITGGGRVRIGVGATLVRHSDPDSEVAETRAKAAGLLCALESGPTRFSAHPRVREELRRRNDGLADFWLRPAADRLRPLPGLAGRTALVVDAEDTFTSMIGHQLVSLGLAVTVRRYDEPYGLDGHDLVVMGPGPGDPRAAADPKIGHLREVTGRLLREGRPFLSVCLSHQVLASRLGLALVRRAVPNQGVQRDVDLFGTVVRAGFYNTYAARSGAREFGHPEFGPVRVSLDPDTGEVHALRGPAFASVQFHPESVLTEDGERIMGGLVAGMFRTRTGRTV